jgi:hypothetical protein
MSQIPAFLIAMSQQMHEQSNRMTADPIFQVRYKHYLVTAPDYNEHHWEIIEPDDGGTLYHSEECNITNLAEWLLDSETNWCETVFDDADFDTRGFHDFHDAFLAFFDECFDVENNYESLPDSLMKIHLQETEEVVKTCLTEADANWFIQRKQHDYPKLYTYAESMCFCPQMIELRNWIMSLTKAKVAA